MAWTAPWTTLVNGGGIESMTVPPRGSRYLQVGTSGANDVDLNDVSNAVEFTAAETTVGVNASEAGDAAGAFTMDVRLVVTGDDVNGSITVASLSAGTPGVYNAPPGRYVLECTTAADANAEVVCIGRGLSS